MKRFIIFSLVLSFCAVTGLSAFAASDMAEYYTKNCASCHGIDGSKSAMKSEPIKGKTAEVLNTMLEGYKAGTYGGDRRSIMEGKVKNADSATLTALSQYIATL